MHELLEFFRREEEKKALKSRSGVQDHDSNPDDPGIAETSDHEISILPGSSEIVKRQWE